MASLCARDFYFGGTCFMKKLMTVALALSFALMSTAAFAQPEPGDIGVFASVVAQFVERHIGHVNLIFFLFSYKSGDRNRSVLQGAGLWPSAGSPGLCRSGAPLKSPGSRFIKGLSFPIITPIRKRTVRGFSVPCRMRTG